MSRFAFALLILIALPGCDAFGGGGVTLETTAAAYAPGDVATLRLTNGGSAEVLHNLCLSTLEVDGDDGWADAPGTTGTCQASLTSVGPSGVAEGNKLIPEVSAAGTYRYVSEVEINGRARAVRTPTFQVR